MKSGLVHAAASATLQQTCARLQLGTRTCSLDVSCQLLRILADVQHIRPVLSNCKVRISMHNVRDA